MRCSLYVAWLSTKQLNFDSRNLKKLMELKVLNSFLCAVIMTAHGIVINFPVLLLGSVMQLIVECQFDD